MMLDELRVEQLHDDVEYYEGQIARLRADNAELIISAQRVVTAASYCRDEWPGAHTVVLLADLLSRLAGKG